MSRSFQHVGQVLDHCVKAISTCGPVIESVCRVLNKVAGVSDESCFRLQSQAHSIFGPMVAWLAIGCILFI